MRRWLFISGAIALIVLVIAITLGASWLNTFVHSAAFRHEVETRAGQTVGGPVQIQDINLNILSGVELRGVVAQIDASHAGGQGALMANVESVNCSYSFLRLIQRRLELTGLTLEKPRIVLTRQAVSASNPPSGPMVTSAPAPAGSAPPSTPFQFVLSDARIDQGALSVKNADGSSLADLNGVDLSADLSGYWEGKNISGKLKIADAVFTPGVHVTDFSSPWIFDPRGNYVTANPFQATAFGGNLAGDYALETGPSVLNLNGKGLDVAQISHALQPGSPTRLSGSLDLQSKWRGVETGQVAGEGDAQLANGKIDGVRILQQLGTILRIRELSSPDLKSVKTHFQVANGLTRFTGLQLDAGIFQMTGDGTVAAGGALDANLVLILSSDAMGRLPREVVPFFVGQQNGSGSVAFHVGGTTSNPQTDLPERILMQGGESRVKNVISNALNKFFSH